MLQNQGRWNQLCQLLQESLEEKGKERKREKKKKRVTHAFAPVTRTIVCVSNGSAVALPKIRPRSAKGASPILRNFQIFLFRRAESLCPDVALT